MDAQGKTQRPKKLYKYQPSSLQVFENLAMGQVFFSHPSAFNDPFEFQVRFDRSVPDRDSLDALRDWAKGRVEEKGVFFDETIVDRAALLNTAIESCRAQQEIMRTTRGVACFSKVVNQPLMWSHYGQGHTGICLELSTESEIFENAIRVDYLPSTPIVDPTRVILSEDPLHELRVRAASKLDCWAYEKEWRCLHIQGGTAYGYKAEHLTGVYLGYRMKQAHKILVGSVLRRTDTQLFQMVEQEDGYGVKAQPIDFSQPDYRAKKRGAVPADRRLRN